MTLVPPNRQTVRDLDRTDGTSNRRTADTTFASLQPNASDKLNHQTISIVKMSADRVTTLRIVYSCAVLLAVVTTAAGACPGVKWKGGKQTVECRGQGLITLPSNIDPQTQVLDLTGSNLQTLPREAFARANLLNLQKIYLASCRIGQIDSAALRGLTNLIDLDLSDNLLTDVPSNALADAVSLRELRLSANPIQKIERRAFEQAPGIAKLDLSDCQITTLAPGAFDGLDQLSHLKLSGNRLEELRPEVVNSLPPRLHGLELYGNPWICDCRLRYLREWLQQHNIPSPATAACAKPARLHGRTLVELQVDDFACPPQAILPATPLLPGSNVHPQMHVEAAAGDNATLTCRVSGVPSPEITWLWRGRPVVNASSPLITLSGGDDETDIVYSSGEGGDLPARVLILESGKYEKTSQLILTPAQESDSGEYVCIAANAAGLARLNMTLRVDVQAPVVGGLGGAQIAGLGAGLFILLAVVVAILLLMLIRTRGSSNRNKNSAKGEDGKTAAATAANRSQPTESTTKSPSLSALEYGQVAFVKPGPTSDRVTVVTTSSPTGSAAFDRPDLIHYSHYADYSTLQRRPMPGQDIGALGDYQSAQTDSFYPSALWDHCVLPTLDDPIVQQQMYQQQQAQHQQQGNSPIHLPHVVPLGMVAAQIIQNPMDGESETAETVSVTSYSLPCRMPTQSHHLEQPGYIPYPSDFGLPRTMSPTLVAQPTAPTVHVEPPMASASGGGSSSTSSYGSKASNSSTESSPASINSSTAKSAKGFWNRPSASTTAAKRQHHFARDSPDEGYQEECATDV